MLHSGYCKVQYDSAQDNIRTILPMNTSYWLKCILPDNSDYNWTELNSTQQTAHPTPVHFVLLSGNNLPTSNILTTSILLQMITTAKH